MTIFGERNIFMRRAVIILILLATAVGVGVLTCFLYNERTEVLECDEMTCADCFFDPDTGFEGKFLCEKRGRQIKSFDYSIEDDTLYITLNVCAGVTNTMETDEDGYVTVTIDDADILTEVEDVRYRDTEKDIDIYIIWK